MGEGAVWISEDEERDELDFGLILTGRFSGFHDTGGPTKAAECFDLDLDAALAWARERADRVYLTLGDARFEAGVERTGEYPAWPENATAPVRRRPPGEEWKDRTAAHEPIDWIVQAWFTLPGGRMPDRGYDEEIAAIAASTGARGWDAEELDRALADVERGRRANQRGWFSYHRGAYRLLFDEHAPTATLAVEQTLRRCGAASRWMVEADAHPATRDGSPRR